MSCWGSPNSTLAGQRTGIPLHRDSGWEPGDCQARNTQANNGRWGGGQQIDSWGSCGAGASSTAKSPVCACVWLRGWAAAAALWQTQPLVSVPCMNSQFRQPADSWKCSEISIKRSIAGERSMALPPPAPRSNGLSGTAHILFGEIVTMLCAFT